MRENFGSLLKRLFTDRTSEFDANVHAPLLSDAELAELIQRVQALNLAKDSNRDVHYRHAGDDRSVYLGSGLDFEEVRPYQRGDEVRDMDWRTTARTGKPYLKIYREEHQPALHIVVDRGASMRFGTRTQLKATMVARMAAIFAFSAMSSNTCIGGTIWQPGGMTLPCRNGEEGAIRLVRAAIEPCPPLQDDVQADTQSFAAMLRQLDTLLPRGSRLVLISDFGQLHEQDLPILMRLSAHHELLVLQVLDAAEENLPNVGLMRFRDGASGKLRWLDTGNHQVHATFQREAAILHDQQRMMFERVGVRLHRCATDDDPYSTFLKVVGYE